ncbi:MAG: DUF1775 domain-containing protein [Parcubacteria group bacterium]|nr:DUF1775 domain-containing protein [Parcubacteria group bacterium]
MKKTYLLLFFIVTLFVFYSPTVFAHSTVTPSQVPASKYETFNLSVPTERDVPTEGVRLIIPEKLERVTPFVKSGWDIEVKTKQEGDKTIVTEIEWTGGAIPAGQKDVFQFTARTPQEDTTLIWKAYQTYARGEVVAWDRDPQKPNEDEKDGKVKNPYSTTEVVADTSASADDHMSSTPYSAPVTEASSKADYTFMTALLALVLSVVALGISLKTAKK